MGHAIGRLSFEKGTDIEKIRSECNEWEFYNKDLQESHICDCGNRIKFLEDTVYATQIEAETALDTLTKGKFYPQIAVLYKRNDEVFKPTAKLTQMYNIFLKAHDRYNALMEKPHYEDCKWSTVTCTNCRSSIAVPYLKSQNFCPVCYKDLRPQSVLDRIKKYRDEASERKNAYNEQLKIEEARHAKNGKLYWLIHLETHC